MMGDLTIGHNVDIGYYAQNQAEELDDKLTVLETLRRGSNSRIKRESKVYAWRVLVFW